jgi:hypothetical protein
MYSCFDLKTLYAITNKDNKRRQYIKDIINKKKDIQQGCNLFKTFGSVLKDISLCITYFEEEKAVLFRELLEYYKSEPIKINPNSVVK